MSKNKLLHLAIIPDGNRRWAKARGLFSWRGHEEGAQRFREITKAVFNSNIPYFTFWAASKDNLIQRNKVEVKFLISLFKKELKSQLKSPDLIKNQICFKVIGQWQKILNNPREIIDLANKLEDKTKNFKKFHLTILFGYDGREEMLTAISKMKNSKKEVTADLLRESLLTGNLPAVDFVIRTGGEPHWSAGFMMWQTADSQLYFTKKLWPDFKENDFKKALLDYQKQERRLGK